MFSPSISSRQHPLIQTLRGLQNARKRRESGLFLVEGRNAVGAALDAKWPLREIVAAPDETELSARAASSGCKITRATDEILAYASETATSPGIAAIGELPAPLDDFDFAGEGLVLVIDGVSDPGNVGTLLRAADAAGARGVILTAGSADVWSPKVVRSAAGSLFSGLVVPLRNREPEAIRALLESKKIPLVSAEAHGGTDCYELRWPTRAALILGHETRGISPVFSKNALQTTIPIWGRAESLNAAMAGTLLMYAFRLVKKVSK